MIENLDDWKMRAIQDAFHILGCVLIEWGMAIYQRRKFSKTNCLAFYLIKSGLLSIFSGKI